MAQFISSAFYLALYTAALALHIGYTVYIQTYVLDLKTMFDRIDINIKGNHLNANLIEIIQLHDSATRYLTTAICHEHLPKIDNPFKCFD